MPQRIPMRSARLTAAIRPTDLSEAFVPMSNLPRHPHSSRLGSASGLILLKVSVCRGAHWLGVLRSLTCLAGVRRPIAFRLKQSVKASDVLGWLGGHPGLARVESTLTLGGLS